MFSTSWIYISLLDLVQFLDRWLRQQISQWQRVWARVHLLPRTACYERTPLGEASRALQALFI